MDHRYRRQARRSRLVVVIVYGDDRPACRLQHGGGHHGAVPGLAIHGHFTELLEPLDLDGAVVTSDALHTARANLDCAASTKTDADIHRTRRSPGLDQTGNIYQRVR